MKKYILPALGILFILFLAWYFGFLNFLKIKGASCSTGLVGGGAEKYIYGKCKPVIIGPDNGTDDSCDPANIGFTKSGIRDKKCDPKGSCPETCNQLIGKLFDDCGFPCPNV